MKNPENKNNWWEKVKNFKLSERTKNILIGLFAVLVVVVFTKSAINIFQTGSDREIKKLEENNRLAEEREYKANKKRDSAIAISKELRSEVNSLKGDVKTATRKIDHIQTSLDKDILDIKNLKNEKNYIPTVSTDEQSQYLSKYKYSEY